jgi:hypothetical protein
MPRLGDKGKLQSSIDATLQKPINYPISKVKPRKTEIEKKTQ